MSTQDDIRMLAQEVIKLTQKVDDLKEGGKQDNRTERQIEKDDDKEARKIAHEARQAKYKEDNSREGQRRRVAPPDRRDDPWVPASRVATLIQPQGMKPQRRAEQPQVQPIIPSSLSHAWKVMQTNDALGKPLPYNVKVVGGNLWTNGNFNPTTAYTVENVDALAVESGQKVVLAITRDSPSRALVSAAIELQDPVSASTETIQYVLLATVSLSATGIVLSILQSQFEELCIDELMTVENGVFKFAPVRLAGQNTYDLPTP